MDIANLFGNTDNLFKFLFSGGILLVVLSIIYPLQKKQEVELEINAHNEKTKLLNNEIKCLDKDVKSFRKETDICFIQLDSLKKLRNNSNYKIISNQIAKVKDDYNRNFITLKDKENELLIKKINLEFDKSRIKILNKHLNLYKRYSSWLLTVGILLSIIGLFFWSISTHRSEKLKKRELNE